MKEVKKYTFANPLMEKNIHKLNPGKYTNLDDYGFIKEETYITDKDVLFAKCFKTTKDDGTEVTKVVGKTANFGTSGIVDKVVVVKNKDGLRTSKVRVRKEKIPGIGDKFASRCGQRVCVEWF